MKLIEAMEKAESGNVVERKYYCLNAGTFTKWGTIKVTDTGKFLVQGWGKSLKLEDLKADNWEVRK